MQSTIARKLTFINARVRKEKTVPKNARKDQTMHSMPLKFPCVMLCKRNSIKIND